jgi:hypothetical protein
MNTFKNAVGIYPRDKNNKQLSRPEHCVHISSVLIVLQYGASLPMHKSVYEYE